jgi:hypothetical protein
MLKMKADTPLHLSARPDVFASALEPHGTGSKPSKPVQASRGVGEGRPFGTANGARFVLEVIGIC